MQFDNSSLPIKLGSDLDWNLDLKFIRIEQTPVAQKFQRNYNRCNKAMVIKCIIQSNQDQYHRICIPIKHSRKGQRYHSIKPITRITSYMTQVRLDLLTFGWKNNDINLKHCVQTANFPEKNWYCWIMRKEIYDQNSKFRIEMNCLTNSRIYLLIWKFKWKENTNYTKTPQKDPCIRIYIMYKNHEMEKQSALKPRFFYIYIINFLLRKIIF